MVTAVFTHPACILHRMGAGHPESPQRLEAVLQALCAPEFAALEWRDAPRATEEQIARVHDARYVRALLAAVPSDGLVQVDPDTAIGPDSGEAMLRAAGALVTAVDAVAGGEVRNAFCAVRPPGHHAEPAQPMGFCFFNNVAVGALHARARHGLRKVAVVDFDVHHGNGTQHMFEHDPDLFYASSHQSPAYPGTGRADERGVAGNVINVPLPPGADGRLFRAAYQSTILPKLEAFAPDILLISAGFDAHQADPLAALALNEADYAWVTTALCQVAARHSQNRVVSALEGGYDLDALASSAKAHVQALMGA